MIELVYFNRHNRREIAEMLSVPLGPVKIRTRFVCTPSAAPSSPDSR